MTPIPDVADYIALGLMAPEPPADACPYCDRVEGHEPDCSEAAEPELTYRQTIANLKENR